MFDKFTGRRAPLSGLFVPQMIDRGEGSSQIPDSGHQPASAQECDLRESEADESGGRRTQATC